MKTSIIIPIWNGADVILECLDAVYQHTDSHLVEVICIDNASADRSADLVTENWPQVKLLRQQVNLGFAGGVNAGMQVARGELFVLLNQDCMVEEGWLAHLCTAMQAHPQWAICGCTLLDADGSIDHAGAYVERPGALGVHRRQIDSSSPHTVDYVTGAVFAIRRSAWEEIGPFDTGYFPAYYEETDYCYRARRLGYEIGYVPEARAVHLRSSEDWLADPLRHTSNQHRSRYRFVAKHWSDQELQEFGRSEQEALSREIYFDQVFGRVLALREFLHKVTETLARREQDLGLPPTQGRERLLRSEFEALLHHALRMAHKLALSDVLNRSEEAWGKYDSEQVTAQEFLEALEPTPTRQFGPIDPSSFNWEHWHEQSSAQSARLQELRRQEHRILSRIHFQAPADATKPESAGQKLMRFVRRIASIISGREHLLQSQLQAVQTARLDALQTYNESLRDILMQQPSNVQSQGRLVYQFADRGSDLQKTLRQLHRRLQLLELMIDYELH